MVTLEACLARTAWRDWARANCVRSGATSAAFTHLHVRALLDMHAWLAESRSARAFLAWHVSRGFKSGCGGFAHIIATMPCMCRAKQACAFLQVCLWRLGRLHAEVHEDEKWRAPSGKDITSLQNCKFWHQLFMQTIKLEAPMRPSTIKVGIRGSPCMPTGVHFRVLLAVIWRLLVQQACLIMGL